MLKQEDGLRINWENAKVAFISKPTRSYQIKSLLEWTTETLSYGIQQLERSYPRSGKMCLHRNLFVCFCSTIGQFRILHRYHPYGIQEGFEVFKVSEEYPVRLGNRTYRTWV